jgi:transketolase
MRDQETQELAINTIRFLSADAVQRANSGHPGLPMGAAAMAYALWSRHLKFDPVHPTWPDRDRFVLSAGHGSMLLYSLLHLTGYDLSLDEIKSFRQWGSRTPGHPEYWEAPGIETTTGPLGQGIGNSVGMAIAAERLAAMYNREGFPLVDHYIYALASDGDLMEGISHEAGSLAGHLKLGRLIWLYDDNHISIDGSTDLTFTEDRGARFEAYNWHVQHVEDGNNVAAVDQALARAKEDPRPSLIAVRTHIGYGLPTRQDTAAAHGEPPGEEELRGAKRGLGWPLEPSFFIPDGIREHFQSFGQRGARVRLEWLEMYEQYRQRYPDLARQFERTQRGDLPGDLWNQLPEFKTEEGKMATRAASGKVLNALAPCIPELIGGSADLTGSNKTDIRGEPAFDTNHRSGRYLHFGVREHTMGAILNGMALHEGLIPYGGTFLVFTDYMRPTLRLIAMMGKRVIHVLTHDSIGLGEDGPTHQPVEHLASLRAIPNYLVIRPADANETSYAWRVALERKDGPTGLILSRQSLPILDRDEFAPAEGLLNGAYVLGDLGPGDPELILMASGSEVWKTVDAGRQLAQRGISVRLVSFPCWGLFERQSQDYRDGVLLPHIRARLAVEAGHPLGWKRWVGEVGDVIGLNRFGASAPAMEIFKHLGFTPQNIVQAAQAMLEGLGTAESR